VEVSWGDEVTTIGNATHLRLEGNGVVWGELGGRTGSLLNRADLPTYFEVNFLPVPEFPRPRVSPSPSFPNLLEWVSCQCAKEAGVFQPVQVRPK
jgi:hypothetical protein